MTPHANGPQAESAKLSQVVSPHERRRRDSRCTLWVQDPGFSVLRTLTPMFEASVSKSSGRIDTRDTGDGGSIAVAIAVAVGVVVGVAASSRS